MGFLESPEDYAAFGVTPPEVIKHDMTAGDKQLLDDPHVHSWKQYGNTIHCEAGRNPHGHLIPVTKLLIGTDRDGAPIYRDIDIFTKTNDDNDKGVARTD